MTAITATLDTLFDADFVTSLGADGLSDRADWLIGKDGTLVHAPAVAVQPEN